MSTSSGSQRPIKGILKNKGSTAASGASAASAASASSVVTPGQQTRGPQARKSKKWDESNIRATCRGAYRDYDLKNINEARAPHVRIQDVGEDAEWDFDAKDQARGTGGHILGKSESNDVQSSQYLLDKIERQRQFELRRKLHYTKGLNIKLGRELIAKELQLLELDDEDEENPPETTEEKTAAGEAEDDGPAGDDLPTPAGDDLPTPAGDDLPTPAGDDLPTPAGDDLPTPAGDDLPTPAGDDLPTPAGDL